MLKPEEICQAVKRKRGEVVTPFPLRVSFWRERFMPRFAEWLTWITGTRRNPSSARTHVLAIGLYEARTPLSRAVDRLAELLRSLPDTCATIPGSRWTVGDAAAHVVMNLRHATLVAAGEVVPWAEDATSAPGTARGIGELNARAVTAEAERHPRALATMLVTAVGDFLATTAQLPPDHPMTSPYYQGEMALDLAGFVGIELAEVLVHGYDIAKAMGRPWPIAADDARLALRAALPLTLALVNPETAHGHTGGYDLRIRGGPRVVFRFADGHASLEEPGDAPVALSRPG